jgi:hypothetical protein
MASESNWIHDSALFQVLTVINHLKNYVRAKASLHMRTKTVWTLESGAISNFNFWQEGAQL